MEYRHDDAAKSRAVKPIPSDIWEEIRRAVSSVEYGTIQVTVHGSKVVQIERNEKLRFDR